MEKVLTMYLEDVESELDSAMVELNNELHSLGVSIVNSNITHALRKQLLTLSICKMIENIYPEINTNCIYIDKIFSMSTIYSSELTEFLTIRYGAYFLQNKIKKDTFVDVCTMSGTHFIILKELNA